MKLHFCCFSFIITTSINSNMSKNFETQSLKSITQYHMCSRLRDYVLKTLMFPSGGYRSRTDDPLRARQVL